MRRALALGSLSLSALMGADLPAWWLAFPQVPRMESSFLQESDSAVFGKLRRFGTLKLAQGGRLRVEYRKGSILVADGKTLVQYDPEARTAQKMNLRRAASEMPLLNILLDPKQLAEVYIARSGPGPQEVTLEPRKPIVPAVTLEGQGRLLKRIRWTDPTGAKQVIELQSPTLPSTLPPESFTFTAPLGTRWLNPGA